MSEIYTVHCPPGVPYIVRHILHTVCPACHIVITRYKHVAVMQALLLEILSPQVMSFTSQRTEGQVA